MAAAGTGSWRSYTGGGARPSRSTSPRRTPTPAGPSTRTLSWRAIGGRSRLVLVAQSMGGFTAPLVGARVPVDLIVLLNAMVPSPGESAGEWWDATGHAEARRAQAERDGRDLGDAVDLREEFFHDVPPDVTAIAMATATPQSGTPFAQPWPLEAWPAIPTRVLQARDDRFFPPVFQQRVARERLGIVPDEMPGGHLVALSRPAELADRLEAYAASAGG